MQTDCLLDVLASSIGSLTNPSKLAKTFKSERQISIGSETIDKYIGCACQLRMVGWMRRTASISFLR